MKIHRINQMHLVPLLRERESIHAGGAPDVVNHSRCGGKMPSKKCPRPKTLPVTDRPRPALGLPPLQIMALNFFRDQAHSAPPGAPQLPQLDASQLTTVATSCDLRRIALASLPALASVVY